MEMKVVPLPRSAARRAVGARRLDVFPYLLVAPIALLLTAISFYPALDAVWLAMTDANLLRLARARFVGFDNFLRLAADPIFLQGLWRTLRWDIAVVFIELAIALPIALFLNLKFRGRGIVRRRGGALYHSARRHRADVGVHVRRQFRRRERPAAAARRDRPLRVVAERPKDRKSVV